MEHLVRVVVELLAVALALALVLVTVAVPAAPSPPHRSTPSSARQQSLSSAAHSARSSSQRLSTA